MLDFSSSYTLTIHIVITTHIKKPQLTILYDVSFPHLVLPKCKAIEDNLGPMPKFSQTYPTVHKRRKKPTYY